MMNGWNMDGWSWVWMTLVMGGGLLVAILIVMTLARRPPVDNRTARDESPEAILGKRFARGEIDENEYQRRLTTLHQH